MRGERQLLLFLLDTACCFKKQELIRDWNGHPEVRPRGLSWVGRAQAFLTLHYTSLTLPSVHSASNIDVSEHRGDA